MVPESIYPIKECFHSCGRLEEGQEPNQNNRVRNAHPISLEGVCPAVWCAHLLIFIVARFYRARQQKERLQLAISLEIINTVHNYIKLLSHATVLLIIVYTFVNPIH